MTFNNRFILTPYYLDQLIEDYETVPETGWATNRFNLPEGKPQERLGALYGPLADFVAMTAGAGERPVSVAGDCCTSIGVLAGLQRVNIHPTLIWFDAHGDFNTWETTPSGFLGGMPLAMIVGKGEQTIVDSVGMQNLPEERIVISDGRDLDPDERVALDGSEVTWMRHVEALLEGSLPEGPLYVHFDTDIVDVADAPAMNYPAPDGPSVGVMGDVFQRLADSGQVIAASLSAWNPALDEDGSTQEVCMGLFRTLVGEG
jgi:arginase